MTKKQCELCKGDIIHVEYGDYDNWVTVVVDKVEDKDDRWIKLTCHYINSDRTDEMYGYKDSLVEVIGTEE